MTKDQTVSDEEWWFTVYAEFEDFVGIGRERVETLSKALLEKGVSKKLVNRLRVANKLDVIE